MPLIALFEGIRILIYPDDHPPAHFHARFAEHEALLSVATGEVLEGSLPAGKDRALHRWYMAHRDELAYLWVLVQEHKAIRRIDR